MVISSLGAGLSLLSMVVSGPSNSFLNNNDSNLLLSTTSSVITPTNIGKFAKMEPVDSKTKVFIDEDDVDFVESLGITLTKEEVNIIDPTDPWIIGPIKSATKSTTKYLYYYYATPDGFDEITDVVMLDNTLDSIVIMLEYLEELAAELYPSSSEKNHTKNILSYIRQTNKDYSTNKWNLLLGFEDSTFLSFVNSFTNRGITPYEFFGAFLPSNLYNSTSYPTIRAEYSISNRPLPFIDPIDNTKEIDLIHMFASLDGAYEKNGHTFAWNTLEASTVNKYPADLLSWGGDLQSTADIYRDKISYGFYFENILLDSNSGSPREDIYADVDAYNIGISFLNQSINDILSNAFASYYANHVTNQSRFSLFMVNLADGWNEETEVYSKQKRRIFYSLGLEITSTNQINDISSKKGAIFFEVFEIMKGNTNTYPSKLTRVLIAESFYEYVTRMASV